MAAAHFLRPMLQRSPGPLRLCLERTGQPLASAVEGAFDSATRRRGLLGRDGLPAGAALVIAPCSAVHTFGMRFPIDVVFANRDGLVVKARAHVPRRRIVVALSGFAVIELPAGTIVRAGLRRGDRLLVGPDAAVGL